MKRTERTVVIPKEADYGPLIRAVMFLDGALQKGVVIGVYPDSMEVSDEDVVKALKRVNELIRETTEELDKLVRALSRTQPGSLALQ
jgi:hypothetical protein